MSESKQNLIAILPQLNCGDDLVRINELLGDAIAAAIKTRKSSVLTVKLAVKPIVDRYNEVSELEFAAVPTTKLPVGEIVATRLYVQEDGTLSRRDPRQPELPMTMKQFRKDTQVAAHESAANE